MKKILIVSASCLALAGCGTTAQEVATNITATTASVQTKVSMVQGYAVQLCKFVPAASTVVSIFSSGYASDVATVANAICNAVTTRPLADGPRSVPRVNGIAIRGKFVN